MLRRLPTCHYERQKASSTGLLLKPMLLEEQFFWELQNVSNCRNNIGHVFCCIDELCISRVWRLRCHRNFAETVGGPWSFYRDWTWRLFPSSCWDNVAFASCDSALRIFGKTKSLKSLDTKRYWTHFLFFFRFWKGTNLTTNLTFCGTVQGLPQDDWASHHWDDLADGCLGDLIKCTYLTNDFATSTDEGATRMTTTISSNLRWHSLDPPVQLTPMEAEEPWRGFTDQQERRCSSFARNMPIMECVLSYVKQWSISKKW